MRYALEPTAGSTWVLEDHGYDPLRERDVEARFAIGNGFLGVRGAREASRGPMWVPWMQSLNWASWPRTYVAGLFDTPNVEPPVPVLLPVADWLRVQIRLNEEPLLLRSGTMLSHCRMLDMRRGVMLTDWHHQDRHGVVVRVRTLRLVSQSHRSIGLQFLHFEIERGGVDVTLEAEFGEAGVGLDAVRLEKELGVWRTEQSGKGLAIAGAASLRVGGSELPPGAADHLKWSWNWTSVPGQVASLERLVAMVRSDERYMDPGPPATEALTQVRRVGWRRVLAAHEAAWAERWSLSDVEIEGDEAAQQALRFAIYHLNSAANPTDERVSIGARALTGDAYLGHVFWDTEIYLLPFYTLTWPEAARALLMYRYHTLDGARAKARRKNFQGALYAWESADTGEEATPTRLIGCDGRPVDILCGEQEQHISADIAYAVWHYWQVTGDEDFLCKAGAEILLETARFWVSRAQPQADGSRHIRGVIGPDEYHENVDDNAYTNVMARWNIRRALDTVSLLRARWPDDWVKLARKLGLEDREVEQWTEAAATLVTGYDPGTGLIEQFAGFFTLADVDLAHYEGRSVTIDQVLGLEQTRKSKVVKQADVVALLALLDEEFDRATIAENFRYYEPRCAHDSSLSRPMHALIAARLGDTERALHYFRQTAAIDLAGTAGDTAGGVHIAALGGLWQVAILGFAGLSHKGGVLSINPNLPSAWLALGFHIQWRGRHLVFRIEQPGPTLTATLEAGTTMTIVAGGKEYELQRSRPTTVSVGSTTDVWGART
ncbi:MAG TPA: glycoside hydrolase family 65 protein [Acetobacteraceae bacterium]|jgi:trehalose/maltose hydrolase-like predicted phosphorylase|nr:glycoside hydrolase family 65 protein [Acetobacteraceae bacterium]